MGFEPTTVGLEVRRSIQTELRALEYESTTNGHKQLGFYSTGMRDGSGTDGLTNRWVALEVIAEISSAVS